MIDLPRISNDSNTRSRSDRSEGRFCTRCHETRYGFVAIDRGNFFIT